jgi:hypothetical protein
VSAGAVEGVEISEEGLRYRGAAPFGQGEATQGWLWRPSAGAPVRVLSEHIVASAPPVLDPRGGLPDVRWLRWLGEGRALAVVETLGVVPRGRLAELRLPAGEVTYLTRNVGSEGRPVMAPDRSALFFEVEHPDPDIAVTWTQVRRLELGRR